MFRLTREVRFSINDRPDDQLSHAPTNGYGGYPSLTSRGQFFRLEVTLEGTLNPASGYLRNIKEIDQTVRQKIIDPPRLHPVEIFNTLSDQFDGDKLYAITLWLSPFLSLTQLASELGMFTFQHSGIRSLEFT